MGRTAFAARPESDREVRGPVVRYGFAALIASTMAWISAVVSVPSEPIPPLLRLMASWMPATVRFETGIIRIALIAPWQPEQFDA